MNAYSQNSLTFPAAELSLILKFMDQYNIPRHRGLLGTIWDAKSAEQETSPVGLDQLDIIYRNIYRLAPSPDVGLHFGNSLNISRWGVLAQALLYSDTLADALREADKMLPLIHSRFLIQHKISRHLLTTYFIKNPSYSIPGSTQFIHEIAFSTLARQISGLLAQPFKFESVHLPYPRPKYYTSYLEICAKSAEFDCEIGAVTLPESTLHRPLKLANKAAHTLAVEMCERELARAEEIASRNIVSLTKRELSKSPTLCLTQDELASRLSQHPRTFRRRLKEAGTNYRKIVKEIRMEIALRELSEKHVPVAEIAKNCGFSSTAVFRDTFKRWTGFSPTEYQKQFP